MISAYLGASTNDKVQVSAQSQVASVARVCSGPKKETLEALKTKGEMLDTSESFLKATLRHYKAELQQASMQKLLHARAKLYCRTGRLLQAWPQYQVKLQQSLANIEAKYASDLVAANAIGGLPPPPPSTISQK